MNCQCRHIGGPHTAVRRLLSLAHRHGTCWQHVYVTPPLVLLFLAIFTKHSFSQTTRLQCIRGFGNDVLYKSTFYITFATSLTWPASHITIRITDSILHIFKRGKIRGNKHRYQRKYYNTQINIHIQMFRPDSLQDDILFAVFKEYNLLVFTPTFDSWC